MSLNNEVITSITSFLGAGMLGEGLKEAKLIVLVLVVLVVMSGNRVFISQTSAMNLSNIDIKWSKIIVREILFKST